MRGKKPTPIAFAVLVLALAGCGGGADDSRSESGASPVRTGDAPASTQPGPATGGDTVVGDPDFPAAWHPSLPPFASPAPPPPAQAPEAGRTAKDLAQNVLRLKLPRGTVLRPISPASSGDCRTVETSHTAGASAEASVLTIGRVSCDAAGGAGSGSTTYRSTWYWGASAGLVFGASTWFEQPASATFRSAPWTDAPLPVAEDTWLLSASASAFAGEPVPLSAIGIFPDQQRLPVVCRRDTGGGLEVQQLCFGVDVSGNFDGRLTLISGDPGQPGSSFRNY